MAERVAPREWCHARGQCRAWHPAGHSSSAPASVAGSPQTGGSDRSLPPGEAGKGNKGSWQEGVSERGKVSKKEKMKKRRRK
eukprot:3859656-Rhodomonas_salina.1